MWWRKPEKLGWATTILSHARSHNLAILLSWFCMTIQCFLLFLLVKFEKEKNAEIDDALINGILVKCSF